MEKLVEVFGRGNERDLPTKDTKVQEGEDNFLDW